MFNSRIDFGTGQTLKQTSKSTLEVVALSQTFWLNRKYKLEDFFFGLNLFIAIV